MYAKNNLSYSNPDYFSGLKYFFLFTTNGK